MAKPKKSNLTQERLKQLIKYDADTGVITWLNTQDVHCGVRGKIAADVAVDGYPRISIDKQRYLQHRIAWLYHYGEWPKEIVDHIDGNKLNNAISNLRDVSIQMNMQNIRSHKKNKFGLLGVYSYGSRFQSHIIVNGKSIFLGIFNTALEAHQAHVAAKLTYHPGFISLGDQS